MKFCELLNSYMAQISCTGKELCARSGISPATFSRYKNGKQVPQLGTAAFDSLCSALERLAREKGIEGITAVRVREGFLACDDFAETDREQLRQNFCALLSTLNINLNRLSRHTSYDVSTLFRIRNGTRRPADSQQFAGAVASFAAREVQTPAELAALAELMGCAAEDIEDLSARYARLRDWLMQERAPKEAGGDITGFLNKLDAFDLNEYIKAIHFDQLKVPSMPFQLPTSRVCTGLREMMDSELDFLKATVLSRSMEPVIMYSDMPMTEMAKDPDFPKKWMFGMAMMLKKGLHLHQIHNLDRSFEEMMLGLESWIPMYMTGQISPYYLKNVQNNVFLHFLKVSGTAALAGEAIAGHHAEGRYYLTKNKREVDYYARRARALLDSAYPLMDIYRSDREKEWTAFLRADAEKPGRRRSILSAPPLYTMDRALLEGILERNQVPEAIRETIFRHAQQQRLRVERVLEESTIDDEVPLLTEEEFNACPPALDLSGSFCERDIGYTYGEYLAHLAQTEAFAAGHPGYSVKKSGAHAFRNLQILMREGQWAMVSKGKAPAIHFVIRHPKLRSAIENFIPPMTEEK